MNKKLKTILILGGAVCALLVTLSVVFALVYMPIVKENREKAQQSQSLLKQFQNEVYNDMQDPEAAAKAEQDNLTILVGRLMDLPDETPSVATVTDHTELAGQPFFANAQDGDKALIYTKAKKAILYRPSTDKIIENMPLSLKDTQ
ncbi:MAG: hypothetical protein PHU42_01250 [Patescibacteria group bacterium]|nr:hypothetical protein [Patescibacteria group bacterium]